MRIGFTLESITNGGQYAETYRRLEVHEDFSGRVIERELIQGFYVIRVPSELEPGYAWMRANKDNIVWDGYPFFVIAPAGFATMVIPAWHPKSGDDGEGTPNTFENQEMVIRYSLNNSKVAIRIGELNASQLTQMDTTVQGNVNVDGYVTKEIRTVLQGVEWAEQG